MDAIAVTGGPGLIGGVIVGVMFAKGLAAAHDKPFIAVNHLEGHALTARLTDDVAYPFLLLLVSGGHCQLLEVESLGRYTRLGGTLDDALGEAFDKVAKMLGLGYPGGPIVEKRAREGDAGRFSLPKPMIGRDDCDFSFSGLKTAVLHLVRECEEKEGKPLKPQTINDICASFQQTCGDILDDRCRVAMRRFARNHQAKTLVVAGGVAANQYLKGRLEATCAKDGFTLVAPPMRLCTDNAAMIAWAGMEHLLAGRTTPLGFAPRARWPLGETA
jgi:N6-L-threonylcarbamoyladenine synthase